MILKLLSFLSIHKWEYSKQKVEVTLPDRDRTFELTFINRKCECGKEQHRRGDGYMFTAMTNYWKSGLITSDKMVGKSI